jgi:phage terminase large subunit-like protein
MVADTIEAYCRITKDTIAGSVGEPMVLHPWQKQLLSCLFAHRVKDDRRRFRTGLIGMPRKNGKSALGAGIALYGLLLDVDGAEVYSCAGDREQARIVFGMTKRMVELDPFLSENIKTYRDVLEVPSTGSIYRVLSAEAYTKEGLSPTMVIFDELHVQPNDELYSTMTLGSGARLNPLVLAITTAGARTDSLGQDSLCYRMYQHGQRVVNGEVKDPSFFFAWWEPKAGTEADHRDPRVWREANPGLASGIVDEEDFRSTVVRTSESEFRTKRTNVWVTGGDSALEFGAWDRCADLTVEVTIDDPVVLGFDGSWAGDSTALVGCTVSETPHMFVVDCWENPDDTEYRVPILEVEERIRQACREFQVVEVACDPYRWQRSMQTLENEGLNIVEYPQSLGRIIPAWTSWSEAIREGRLTHDGDPRMARHIENMRLKTDSRGSRPTKESKSSRRHIDLGIAGMMAHDRAINIFQTPTTRAPEVAVIVL